VPTTLSFLCHLTDASIPKKKTAFKLQMILFVRIEEVRINLMQQIQTLVFTKDVLFTETRRNKVANILS
jgi:hypothetical protein